jgi:hypothetical protein
VSDELGAFAEAGSGGACTEAGGLVHLNGSSGHRHLDRPDDHPNVTVFAQRAAIYGD